MTGRPERWAYLGAAGAGAMSWLVVAALAGRQEAWDSKLYWVAGYPVLVLAVGWIAWRVPARAWRWGLAAIGAQAALTLGTAEGEAALWPYGAIAFAVLAVPLVAAGLLIGRLRRRHER